jgi:hypothetical protein
MNQVWSINQTGTGRGIREVVRPTDLYLAGHLHPTVHEITRRGSTVSVTVTALTYEWANILYCPDSCIFGCFGFFFHILIYVLPWWGVVSDVLDNFEDVLFGNPTYTPLAWYEMLVIGPLYQVSRLRKVPGALYAYSVFTGVMFAAFHMYTMKLDNGIDENPIVARAFIWGVYFDSGVFQQSAMLATLLLLYEVFFFLPGVNFIGFWFERDPKYSWNCTQLICAGILVLVMFVGFIGLGVLMYLAGGWETVTTAPVMIVMLLTLLVIFFGLPTISRKQERVRQLALRVAVL